MNRRGFLLGAGASLLASPAIVRVASLMAVRAMPPEGFLVSNFLTSPHAWFIETDGLWSVETDSLRQRSQLRYTRAWRALLDSANLAQA